jgi:hypothetical protein
MTAEEWTEFRGIKDVPEDKPYLYGKDKDGKKMAFHGNARKLEFFLLEREVSTKPFDLMATIISLVKRAEKVREDQIKAGEKPTVALAQIVELKKLSEHIKEYKDPAPEIASVEKQEETNLEILQVEGEQEGEKQEETLVGAKVPETNPDANQEEKAA